MTEPWRSWFAAGVGRFGLSPAEFWALTLAEWRALTSRSAGPAPMRRAELDALLHLDRESDHERQDA
ncbi:MAG: phage tail assembly chaperone [Oceanicaulis sp.]